MDYTEDDTQRRLARLQLRIRLLKCLTAVTGAVAIFMAINYNLPQRRVYLPFLIVMLDGWDAGIVSAQGTWTSDANRVMYPSGSPDKASKIVCYKDLGYCFESIATLKDNVLLANHESWPIEHWDAERVTTRPESEGICLKSAISINRKMKSVDALVVRANDGEFCNGFPKEQHLRLSDGSTGAATGAD
jgi:hypothetical protein